jgi:GAF domain-containing protein
VSRHPQADARDALLKDLIHIIEGRGERAFIASVLALEHGELRHAAAPNLPASYNEAVNGLVIGPDRGSCGSAAFLGHPIYVSDIASDRRWAPFTGIMTLALEAGLRACWSVPIMTDGKVLGTFAIYHRESRGPTMAERNLLAEASQTAAFLFNRNLTAAAPVAGGRIVRL